MLPIISITAHCILVAFNSVFSTATSFLDAVDTAPYLAKGRTNSLPVPLQELQRAISTYEIVLFAPVEYLSRTCRADLVRRAVVADILVSSLLTNANHSMADCSHSLSILRIFLLRNLSYGGVVHYLVSIFCLLGFSQVIHVKAERFWDFGLFVGCQTGLCPINP
jgi:hypothetical protein